MYGVSATDATQLLDRRAMVRSLMPVAFVILSLLAMIALALSFQRQVVEMGEELTRIGDPLQAAVRDVQVSLALETAGTRGFLLTGESRFVRGHQAARTARKAAVRRLVELAPLAPPQTAALIHRLDADLRPADVLLDSLYEGRLSRESFAQRLPAQQERLEAVTETARRLVTRVNLRTVSQFEDLRRVQTRTLVSIAVLIALALIAVVQVARLGLGYRALAFSENQAHMESEAAWLEAERRRAESESLAESRARLVRGFTHDVKNPLGAAAGYLQLLENGAIDPDDGVGNARRTIASALQLLDDLLLFAQAESGKLIVRPAPFDLCELARQVVEDCRALAESKGLSVAAETPEGLPMLVSDRDRVRQILENFVLNAVKYTDTGSVTVRVRRWTDPGADRGEEWARVDVQDTGPGLTAAQREIVFREFQRLETSAGTAGSGLGLAVSRQIARALGGDTAVESEVGAGSTFTLRLPGQWHSNASSESAHHRKRFHPVDPPSSGVRLGP